MPDYEKMYGKIVQDGAGAAGARANVVLVVEGKGLLRCVASLADCDQMLSDADGALARYCKMMLVRW